eukprot:scaffold11107_cov115-Isochrysis_galbana.AAC.6
MSSSGKKRSRIHRRMARHGLHRAARSAGKADIQGIRRGAMQNCYASHPPCTDAIVPSLPARLPQASRAAPCGVARQREVVLNWLK